MTSLGIKPKNSDLEADTTKPLRLNEWRTTDKKKKVLTAITVFSISKYALWAQGNFEWRTTDKQEISLKKKRRKRYWNMNTETTLWFNMKRRRPLKNKLYYKFKQNQESFNAV